MRVESNPHLLGCCIPLSSPPLRALSALAHWSPVFGETGYLPGLVFPFIKLFQNNQLVTFELLATILSEWTLV